MTEQSVDLAQVQAEIDEEVRNKRESGAFDLAKEQELERAFLLFAPRQGHTGAITATLRGVDAAVFVDPVAPITSNRPAGRVIKKTMRKASFWYFNWLADQVTRAFSMIAVALHLVEDELEQVNQRLDLVTIDTTPVLERPGRSTSTSWWVPLAMDTLSQVQGRVLIAACGDGWLVKTVTDAGGDAYGIDARPGQIQKAQLHGLDLREDDLIDHLSHVAALRLAGVVLTGTTEGVFITQRSLLLDRLEEVLSVDGTLIIHAQHPDSMLGDEIPPMLDFVGAKPMRPGTWSAVLEERGFEVTTTIADDGSDFLVVARRPGILNDA